MWAGAMLSGEPWLLYYNVASDSWVTVRNLSEYEVEEYQRITGNYFRS
jgi:hypothetical protein